MLKINLFKIKKGKIKKWENWGRLLMTKHKKEALKTLIEEGLTDEAFGIFTLNGESYTIGISVGEHLPTDRNDKLNIKHKKIKKECLDLAGYPEFIYQLNVMKK